METITITPNGYRLLDGEDAQVTFFTVTYKGQTYKYHGNTPVLTGQPLRDWLDANAEVIMCDIYRKQYMGAKITPAEGQTLLDAWEAWIAGGCKNGEEVIPQKAWKDTHPNHAIADGTVWLD